jgi:hypothetical protein
MPQGPEHVTCIMKFPQNHFITLRAHSHTFSLFHTLGHCQGRAPGHSQMGNVSTDLAGFMDRGG